MYLLHYVTTNVFMYIQYTLCKNISCLYYIYSIYVYLLFEQIPVRFGFLVQAFTRSQRNRKNTVVEKGFVPFHGGMLV